MAEPTEKSEGIESFLKAFHGGVDRRDTIRQGVCVAPPVGCGRENIEGEFRNDLSRKEYTISGLCQKCQDEVFKCVHGTPSGQECEECIKEYEEFEKSLEAMDNAD
jgi:hypothetical protein